MSMRVIKHLDNHQFEPNIIQLSALTTILVRRCTYSFHNSIICSYDPYKKVLSGNSVLFYFCFATQNLLHTGHENVMIKLDDALFLCQENTRLCGL